MQQRNSAVTAPSVYTVVITGFVAVRAAVASEASVTLTLERLRSVDARGVRVAVVQSQQTLLHIRNACVEPTGSDVARESVAVNVRDNISARDTK